MFTIQIIYRIFVNKMLCCCKQNWELTTKGVIIVVSVGKRIKKGRTLRGLSLRELGEKANLSHSQISYIENGKRSVTGPVLLSLSKALNLPIDYFVSQKKTTIEGVSFRKIKALPKKENDMIFEKIEQQVENYLELEEIMDVHTSFNRNLLDGHIIESIGDIETITQVIRKEYKLGQAAIPNVAGFLENIGIKVIGVVGKKGFDGVSFFVNNNIPIIAYNTSIGSTERQRMTLLHELGHLLIEPLIEGVESKKIENLCTAFASHLLLPSEVIKEYFGGRRKTISIPELVELQHTYGISIDAIVYRLKEMFFISDSNYKGYCIEKNKNPKLKESLERSRYVEPESSRFIRLVIRALDSSIITRAKALIYLNGCGIIEDEATDLLNSKI